MHLDPKQRLSYQRLRLQKTFQTNPSTILSNISQQLPNSNPNINLFAYANELDPNSQRKALTNKEAELKRFSAKRKSTKSFNTTCKVCKQQFEGA